MAYGNNSVGEDNFYDTRDDKAGGSDTQWSPNWGENEDRIGPGLNTVDIKFSFSGVKSQQSLAGSDYTDSDFQPSEY